MNTEHYNHLQQLFSFLIEHGLVNMAKCEFQKPPLEFLRHRIDKHGASPLLSKIQAVVEFPAPDIVKGLQEFLSMVIYYHHFLSRMAAILQPLFTAMTPKNKHIQ